MKTFVDRAPRVPLQDLHDLEMEMASDGAKVRLHNVSASGVGALLSSFGTAVPAPGAVISARMRISSQIFEIRLRVAHHTGPYLGAAYVKPPLDFVQALQQYFDAELAALDFVLIDPQLLKPEPDGVPTWYQGLNNSGLFYVVDGEGAVVRYHLEFFGNRIEGGRNKPLRFGQQVTQHDADRMSYQSSTELNWDSAWPRATHSLALRVLRAVPHLPPGVAGFIEHSMSQIPVAPDR